MNAEIYFIDDDGVAIPESYKKRYIRDLIFTFQQLNINILYRTSIFSGVNKIKQAFIDTKRSCETIDMVISIGGLYNNSHCVVKKFLSSRGIDLGLEQLPSGIEFLYTHPERIPGYIFKDGGLTTFFIPFLPEDTMRIVKNYLVPYIYNLNEETF